MTGLTSRTRSVISKEPSAAGDARSRMPGREFPGADSWSAGRSAPDGTDVIVELGTGTAAFPTVCAEDIGMTVLNRVGAGVVWAITGPTGADGESAAARSGGEFRLMTTTAAARTATTTAASTTPTARPVPRRPVAACLGPVEPG